MIAIFFAHTAYTCTAQCFPVLHHNQVSCPLPKCVRKRTHSFYVIICATKCSTQKPILYFLHCWAILASLAIYCLEADEACRRFPRWSPGKASNAWTKKKITRPTNESPIGTTARRCILECWTPGYCLNLSAFGEVPFCPVSTTGLAVSIAFCTPASLPCGHLCFCTKCRKRAIDKGVGHFVEGVVLAHGSKGFSTICLLLDFKG